MYVAIKNKVVDVQVVWLLMLSLVTLESMCETSLGIRNSKDEKSEKHVKAIGTLGYQIRTRFLSHDWPYHVAITPPFMAKDFMRLELFKRQTHKMVRHTQTIISETVTLPGLV